MLKLIHTQRLGLDVWLITLGGKELHMFLSEQYARVRYETMKAQLVRAGQVTQ